MNRVEWLEYDGSMCFIEWGGLGGLSSTHAKVIRLCSWEPSPVLVSRTYIPAGWARNRKVY